MNFLNQGRVNIVITNKVLRYAYSKNPSTEGITSHGEITLPAGTIKDGTIVDKSAFYKIIEDLVQTHKWKRKKLHFAIPDDTVVIRKVQIPSALTQEESSGYIRTQLGNSFYLPFANPAIATEFLEANGESRDALLFAYPKDKLHAFEVSFEDAGLKPTGADLTSLSVYRYYFKNAVQPGENHVLLIHWNEDSLVLTAFQQHKAIFTRYMKVETSKEELTEEYAMQIISEHLIEINRIIDFYQYSITKGESRINQLLLSGDFSFLNEAKEQLIDTVPLPVYTFNHEKFAEKYTDVLGLSIKPD
ncbi:type IV pilus biogenesis protein PilM [Virgibacillus kekensis]|uniref:Type IV pilus biogenesis protein PilM n=1 Tax=Virgibacillus kekensis TaxID=202261 RepID=A0ABV9DFE4_9BACI